MKYYVLSFLIYVSLNATATDYYVSPAGSNANDGLTPASAFQTLNYAADQTEPGDTVFVMDGTYTNSSSASNVLDIYNSGTSDSRITYKNYPGANPLIVLTENNWSGIAIQGADYITIDGFQIVGNNDAITLEYAISEQFNTGNPATSGNGIGITREYNNDSNKPHHNVIRNCVISKCGGGGIYGYWADYTTIENNTIFECAWYAPYGNSAISLYQNWNSDSADVVRNYIVGNTCYRNENYIPFIAIGEITDGNGIIIDDGRNTQNNSTQGIYLGKTYIANNLIYDNGGRGIHVYLSDNVVIANNTCYQNCKSRAIQDGEFTAYSSDNILIVNNIAFPSAGILPIDEGNTNDLTVEYNLWAANSNLANPAGTNWISGNPDFVMPSNDPSLADFHLLSTSYAINAGTISNAPLTDKDGFTRLPLIDMGCYEYQTPSSIVDQQSTELVVSFYPNPASNVLSIQTNVKESREFLVTVTDAAGHSMIQSSYWSKADSGIIALDLSDYCEGIYFVNLIEKLNNFNTCFKVVKLEN
jgi:parallel beta-helix repeat protein